MLNIRFHLSALGVVKNNVSRGFGRRTSEILTEQGRENRSLMHVIFPRPWIEMNGRITSTYRRAQLLSWRVLFGVGRSFCSCQRALWQQNPTNHGSFWPMDASILYLNANMVHEAKALGVLLNLIFTSHSALQRRKLTPHTWDNLASCICRLIKPIVIQKAVIFRPNSNSNVSKTEMQIMNVMSWYLYRLIQWVCIVKWDILANI